MTPIEVCDQLREAVRMKDAEMLADLWTEDGTFHVPGGWGELKGRQAIQQWFLIELRAMPDLHSDLRNRAAHASTVIIEELHQGTFTGPLRTPTGDLAPTGKSFTEGGCMVLEIEGDRIKAARAYFDALSINAQVGISPMQEAQVEAVRAPA